PAHAALALDRLDEDRRDALRPAGDVGRQRAALRSDERGHGVGARRRLRDELVERVDLAPEGVLALVGMGQLARDEQIPQLFQAALFAPHGLLRRAAVLDRKRDVRPLESRKAEARLLAVRDGQAAEGAAVK